MLRKIFKIGRQKLWLFHREHLREKHELSYLFWEASLNCNFNCKHCGSKAGEKTFDDSLKLSDIKKTFLDIANNFNANKITIAVTGGEPLLRKDLFEAMKYAKSLGFRWGMVTNAWYVNEDIVNKCKEAGMSTVDISIDGIKEVHDEFRNTKESYSRAINAIKLFNKANFLKTLRVTTTVHKKNINNLEEMYKVFSSLNISSWRLLSVEPIGRAIDSDILLNKKEFIKLLQFIKHKRISKSNLKVVYTCSHFLGDEYEDEVRNNFFYCATGINVGSILHNGDIFVCPNVPRKNHLIQGNIKNDSFSEVWNNKFKVFRDINRTSCENCKNCSYWQECLGGSFHSWDFDEKKPKVCFMNKDLYKK